MPTRNNIYHDLAQSPFSVTSCHIVYHFSSRIYYRKFTDRLWENREEINRSLSERFKVEINVPVLCDLVLYSKIEKRGFRITTEKEGDIICLDNLKFAGGRVIVKTSTEKSGGLTLNWTDSQKQTRE